jgi:hypothetical protein
LSIHLGIPYSDVEKLDDRLKATYWDVLHEKAEAERDAMKGGSGG